MSGISSLHRVWDKLNAQPERIYFIVLLLLAIVVRYLVFVTYFDGQVAMGFDSGWYIDAGVSAASEELTLEKIKARPWRQLLYPYFLAVHYKIFGVTQYPVILTQVLLSVCVVVITFLIARETIGKRGAYMAGILAAFYFNELEWAFFILRDHLSLFLVILTFYLLIRWSKDRSPLYLLAGGVVYLLSLACRLDNAVFVPAILLWAAYNLDLRRRLNTPMKALAAILIALTIVIVVGGPFAEISLGYMRGNVAFGTQWDIWQRQNRIGVPPGTGNRSWEEIRTFVINHPVRYISFALERFLITWLLPLHPGYSLFHRVYNLTLYPLAFFALTFTTVNWIKGHLNRKVFAFLLLLWLSKTLLIMVTIIDWDFRYRLPVDFIALICLAHLLDRSVSFVQGRLPTTVRSHLPTFMVES